MAHLIPIVLLVACCVVGLLLVVLGLPGLWVMVLGVVGYGWLTDFRTVGVVTIAVALGLAFLGEIVEFWIGFRLAGRYGGSRRAGWGALLGGLVGAVTGGPGPLIRSGNRRVVGAFGGPARLGPFAPGGPKRAGRAGGAG